MRKGHKTKVSLSNSIVYFDESKIETRKSTKNKSLIAEKINKTIAKMVSTEADETRITTAKKRRMSLNGTSIPTSVAIEKAKGHEKPTRKPNAPFQRIKADQVTYHDERLKDNTFVARVRYPELLRRL